MTHKKPPGGGAEPSWRPSIDEAASIWKAVSSEPGTGVSILTVGGRIVYTNDAAARMAIGPEALGVTQMGRTLGELFPKDWTDERLVLLARVVRTGEPVILRTVWNGAQMVSWLYPINGPEPSGEGEASEPDSEDKVLVVTRLIGGEKSLRRFGLTGTEVFESGVARLGGLDVLTPRELEVLALLGQGLSLQEIAALLFRSQKTIARHRDAIGKKLALGDRVRLAELAWRAGLTIRDAERKRV